MMNLKKQVMGAVFLVLAFSFFVFAVDDVSNEVVSDNEVEVESGEIPNSNLQAPNSNTENCGFFCRIVQWWSSRLGGEAAAGKASAGETISTEPDCIDVDNDGICADLDNCPLISNSEQEDTDSVDLKYRLMDSIDVQTTLPFSEMIFEPVISGISVLDSPYVSQIFVAAPKDVSGAKVDTILVYQNGVKVDEYSKPGSVPESQMLDNPQDVLVRGDFLYIADFGNERVQKLNAVDGIYITEWDVDGKPIALAERSGFIFVLNGNGDIKKITSSGVEHVFHVGPADAAISGVLDMDIPSDGSNAGLIYVLLSSGYVNVYDRIGNLQREVNVDKRYTSLDVGYSTLLYDHLFLGIPGDGTSPIIDIRRSDNGDLLPGLFAEEQTKLADDEVSVFYGQGKIYVGWAKDGGVNRDESGIDIFEFTAHDGIGDACDNCPDHYNPSIDIDGDGILDYQLNSDSNDGGDVCDLTICGDFDFDMGEECENGNALNGDGCSSTCTIEPGWNCQIRAGRSICYGICGDNLLKGLEECDDGNTNNDDGCSSICKNEPDIDGDGLFGLNDNCPLVPNPYQADFDRGGANLNKIDERDGFFTGTSTLTSMGQMAIEGDKIYLVEPSTKNVKRYLTTGSGAPDEFPLSQSESLPVGIVVDGEYFYVTDVGTDKVTKYNVVRLSLGRGYDVNPVIPSTPVPALFESGRFSNPYGIDRDALGNIYVVDSGNGKIQKFDSNGVFVLNIGSPGRRLGELMNPTAIAVRNFVVDGISYERVYVIDAGNGRIQYFDLSGNFKGVFGEDVLEEPQGINVDVYGYVYVTDKSGLVQFNHRGDYLKRWSGFNFPAGAVDVGLEISLSGVAVDFVYVVDKKSSSENRFQKFFVGGGDGVGNVCDNCILDVNPDQLDSDSPPDGKGDACDPVVSCGDNRIEGEEECDGNINFCELDAEGRRREQACDSVLCDYSTTDCTSIDGFCGDRIRNGFEECDDGKTCPDSTSCTTSCGGLAGALLCQQRSTDTCTNSCLWARCGDRIVQPAGRDGRSGTLDDETCDDGNGLATDSCDNLCRIAICGNGIIQTPEVCDDGKQCSDGKLCTLNTDCNGIGDGLCKTRDSDGCSASCQKEESYLCPSLSGLAGFWKGEGNVIEAYGRYGSTAQGGLTFTSDVDGKVGKSFSLDGSGDYVSIDPSPNLKPANALTLSAWVKHSGTGERYILATEDGYQSKGYSLYIDSSNRPIFRLGKGFITGSSGYNNDGLTGSAIGTNWHQITATFDGTTLILYVDGEEVIRGARSLNTEGTKIIPYGTHQINIGADSFPGSISRFFNGLIDEAQIYNKALTPEEVYRLYAGCQLQCGDGIVGVGETCDDGNIAENDGCSNTCIEEEGYSCTETSGTSASVCITTCNDGILAGTEQCDDGNSDSTDWCTPSCQLTFCGDGIIQSPNGIVGVGETCDDGNTVGNDGCSTICIEENGWSCTETSGTSASVCITTCNDGILAGTEQCDDGNNLGGDGCPADCQGNLFVCENIDLSKTLTFQQTVEQAWADTTSRENNDEGYAGTGFGFDRGIYGSLRIERFPGYEFWSSSKESGYYSDILEAQIDMSKYETVECLNGDLCIDNACAPLICGNGRIESGEECDDGNSYESDSCLSSCKLTFCGDGSIQLRNDGLGNAEIEDCDNGADNGVVCTASYGETCNYCTSSCTPATVTGAFCGDGVVQTGYGEQCEGTLRCANCKYDYDDDNILDNVDACPYDSLRSSTGNCYTCPADSIPTAVWGSEKYEMKFSYFSDRSFAQPLQGKKIRLNNPYDVRKTGYFYPFIIDPVGPPTFDVTTDNGFDFFWDRPIQGLGNWQEKASPRDVAGGSSTTANKFVPLDEGAPSYTHYPLLSPGIRTISTKITHGTGTTATTEQLCTQFCVGGTEVDVDSDNICDFADNCLTNPNENQLDTDGDSK
ncbi:DUF4215 domain-containing protein, partial [Candidatus Woesearchaeota archaeon]|nr:DUF4215 domain-containing protein [Candidatus Woesearchaeota archaeon]